jgi:hypothetical protein
VLFFETDNLFNWFKKCKFLAPNGRNKKNLLYIGRIKKKITGEKQNSHTLQRYQLIYPKKYLFVLYFIKYIFICLVLSYRSIKYCSLYLMIIVLFEYLINISTVWFYPTVEVGRTLNLRYNWKKIVLWV